MSVPSAGSTRSGSIAGRGSMASRPSPICGCCRARTGRPRRSSTSRAAAGRLGGVRQGTRGPAGTFLEFAAVSWGGFGGERAWMYDYYPYHRGELVLLTDPTAHEEALSSIESLLTVAAKQGWPESIC